MVPNPDRKHNRLNQYDSEHAMKRAVYTRLGAAALAIAILSTNKSPEPLKARSAEEVSPVNISEEDAKFPLRAGEAAIFDDSRSKISKNSESENTVDTLPTIGLEAVFDALSPDAVEALLADPTIISTNSASVNTARDDTTVSASSTSENRIKDNGSWDGPVLNAYNGLIDGPSGEETYYNLPMEKVVERMHDMGIEGEYKERDDGVKMLGDYVMVAADLKVHPRGSIVETSLGPGIVCDTGEFAKTYHNRLDIATNWQVPKKK